MAKSHIAPERLAYSVKDAAAIIGISHHTLYDLVHAGKIEMRRLGTRSLVTAEELRRFLNALPVAVVKSDRAPAFRRKQAAAA